jgi:uncharacterized protein YkwD
MMRSRLILAIAAALLVAGAAAGTVTAKSGQVSTAQRVTRMPTLEDRVLDAINELRRAHGLAELQLNAKLATTARDHSLSMAENGYFRHSALGGSGFWSGIESKYGDPLWRVGENLVWASPRLTARQALQLWMNSPPHRANLLAPIWREIGLGAVHSDAAPGVYQGLAATIVTADFGARR